MICREIFAYFLSWVLCAGIWGFGGWGCIRNRRLGPDFKGEAFAGRAPLSRDLSHATRVRSGDGGRVEARDCRAYGGAAAEYSNSAGAAAGGI